MKVGLVFSDIFAGGGYPRDVRWLAGALSRAGVDVTIFGRRNPLNWRDGLDEKIRFRDWRALPFVCRGFDLIHVVGLFELTQPLAAISCAVRGVPFVVSPLGHLLPLHLAVKRHKKALFLRRFWLPWLKRARAFHVFSDLEAESVKEWVPNATTFEGTLGVFPGPDQANLPRSPRHGNGVRDFLFFGRNDVAQKGLDILVEAYAAALKSLQYEAAGYSIRLTIAGQAWNGSAQRLKENLRRLGIEGAVRMIGAVDDGAKWRLLAETDYLVFLSRWDGPPRPIREAIAAGTPVIVTPETNMSEMVEQFGAGFGVSLDAEAVSKVLVQTALEGCLLDRCRAGVAKLRRHLGWGRVAEDYIKGYEMVLSNRLRGPRPLQD